MALNEKDFEMFLQDLKAEDPVAPPLPPRKKKKLGVRPPVTLLPSQLEHFSTLNSFLDKMPFALDLSMLGSGKTYTSAHIAIQRGYKHVIVICPVSVIPKWKQMEKTYNIDIDAIMGYQALRSVKFHQPKHGLLSRRDFKEVYHQPHPWRIQEFVRVETDKVEFTPTPAYREMVDEGTLLIIDEIQNIKNISNQFHAAEALIKEITLRHGPLIETCHKNFTPSFVRLEPYPDITFKSHVLLLSGSPMDKEEHSTHLFRALGIMTEQRTAQYNIQTQLTDATGALEIFDFCRALNPTEYNKIPPRKYDETYSHYIYKMFQQVFKPKCSSAMKTPQPGFVLSKRNAYYSIDPEGAEIIARGLSTLRAVSNFDGEHVNLQANAMSGIARSLQIIETGKIKLFARIASEYLEDESFKIVIAVNYSDTITDLVGLLKHWNPLVFTGSTTEGARALLLEKFQCPSTEHRLLICNQGVISTGIDLDDKHGSFPRVCLVSPNYSTITSYQLGHRFQRMDTKSDAEVHFVFAKRHGVSKYKCQDIIELRVLDALSKKSKVMKETTSEQVDAGVVFPGDHEEWMEDGMQENAVHVPKNAEILRLEALLKKFPAGSSRHNFIQNKLTALHKIYAPF